MEFLYSAKFLNSLSAIFLTLIGYFIAQRLSNLIARMSAIHFSAHHLMLLKRIVFYSIFILFSFAGLQHLGFNLSVLLGAAGIFTVAISFASQTAASNLISGIFLLFEQPFKVGDNIEVKNINGIVESIDLLSTKLITSDNRLVRIPNETMIKSDIFNLSYFATRRIDLRVDIAYSEDISKVKALVLNIASHNKGVLDDPAPNVIINNFANSAVELKFMVWVNTAAASAVKSQIQEEIKQQLDKEGIEMPHPQMTIHQV